MHDERIFRPNLQAPNGIGVHSCDLSSVSFQQATGSVLGTIDALGCNDHQELTKRTFGQDSCEKSGTASLDGSSSIGQCFCAV